MNVVRVEFRETLVVNLPRIIQAGKDGVTEIEYEPRLGIVGFTFKGRQFAASIHGAVKYVEVTDGEVVPAGAAAGSKNPEPLMKIEDDPAEDAKIDA